MNQNTNPFSTPFTLLLTVAFLAGCASTTKPPPPSDWVGPEELTDFWQISDDAQPQFLGHPGRDELSPAVPVGYYWDANTVVCATVGFRIEPDGSTSSHGLIEVDPEDGSWSLDQTVRDHWRPAVLAARASQFQPAHDAQAGSPVFTYKTYAWGWFMAEEDRENFVEPVKAWCENRLAQGVPGPAAFAIRLDRRPASSDS